jgi:hypothetical protein
MANLVTAVKRLMAAAVLVFLMHPAPSDGIKWL